MWHGNMEGKGMFKWIKDFLFFWILYVVKIPSQYKDYKQMIKLQNRLNTEGYCEIFLSEFELMNKEEQQLHLMMFLDIVRANPEIAEEASFEVIKQYAEKYGVIING